MHRFLAFPLLSGFFLLGLGCVVAMLYGNITDVGANEIAERLDLCDGDACFMGQVPGKSEWTFDQQVSIETSHPEDDRMTVNEMGDVRTTFTRSLGQDTVGRIDMRFGDQSPFHLGWLLERFGAPCGMSMFGSRPTVIVHYPFLTAQLLVDNKQFNPFTRVYMLSLYDPNDERDVAEPACSRPASGTASGLAWQGFAPVWFYQSQF